MWDEHAPRHLLVEAGDGDGEEGRAEHRAHRSRACCRDDPQPRNGKSRVGPTQEVSGTNRVEFSLRADGLACPTCVTNIESLIDRLPGVDRVQANSARSA